MTGAHVQIRRTLGYACCGDSARGPRGRRSELECDLSLRMLCRGVSYEDDVERRAVLPTHLLL